MNAGVHVSCRFLAFPGFTPSSGIAGSSGSSIFRFLRNFHTVLRGPVSKFYSQQQCNMVPFSSCSPQVFFFWDFVVMVVLTGERWYLIVVFFELAYNFQYCAASGVLLKKYHCDGNLHVDIWFLKFCLVLKLFSITNPKTQVSFTASRALWICSAPKHQFSSCCFRKRPQGGRILI